MEEAALCTGWLYFGPAQHIAGHERSSARRPGRSRMVAIIKLARRANKRLVVLNGSYAAEMKTLQGFGLRVSADSSRGQLTPIRPR